MTHGFTLEHDGAKLRLRDPDGGLWTVYDTVFNHGRHTILPHSDRRATARVFVPPDPEQMRRSYDWRPGESRELELEQVVRQWRASSYFTRKRYDPSERTAR